MFVQWRPVTVCSAFVFGLILLTGCGGPPAESSPGHPVNGKVTINGKEPGTFASIVFVSVANPSETGSAGVEPSGIFSGRVPLGKCKVALQIGGPPTGPGGGGAFPKGGGPTGPPGGSGGPGGSNGPPLMKGAEIPKKFQDVKTSGIEVDVVEGKDVNIDFK